MTMDTSSFFIYPTPAGEEAAPEAGLLAVRTEEDWDVVLAYTETRRLRPGDWLIREGEQPLLAAAPAHPGSG